MRQPLRAYGPATGRRDVDQAARARLFRTFTLSLTGLALGGLASLVGMSGMGWSLGTAILVTGGVWALAFVAPLAASALGGRVARQVYAPSGRTTPSKREYSLAESLVARGLYQEAVDAFEVAIAEDASDPTPYLRIARIYRNDLQRYEESADWFKRALRDSEAPAGTAHLAARELVELYVTKLGEPRRAAPLLARLLEEHAGTPEADWAAEQLAQVKAAIAEGTGA